MGLGMASVAHRWSVGGVGSRQRGKTGGIFVGNPDGGGLLVGLPVGYGGVGGQAVGLAAGVCLRMICPALSVLVGRVGQSQLYGAGGILVGVLVCAGMLVGVLGGSRVVFGMGIDDGVVGRVVGGASASTWLVSRVG